MKGIFIYILYLYLSLSLYLCVQGKGWFHRKIYRWVPVSSAGWAQSPGSTRPACVDGTLSVRREELAHGQQVSWKLSGSTWRKIHWKLLCWDVFNLTRSSITFPILGNAEPQNCSGQPVARSQVVTIASQVLDFLRQPCSSVGSAEINTQNILFCPFLQSEYVRIPTLQDMNFQRGLGAPNSPTKNCSWISVEGLDGCCHSLLLHLSP